MINEKTAEIIKFNLGYAGVMLSSLKKAPEGQTVIWNANILNKKEKLWFGDFNLTKDKNKLDTLAKALGTDIYLLREMDARFGNEENPNFDKAVYIAKHE